MSAWAGWTLEAWRCNGWASVAVAMLGISTALPCLAQAPGTLDTSFGGTGIITTAVSAGTGDDRAYAVAVQPDNRIVVAGTCQADFCMVRYLADGSLDTSFGTGGRVIQHLVGDDSAYAMALQPDGRIVLAGSCIPTS